MQTITIDNREFQGVTQELSAAQDDYLIGQLRLAGALELVAVPVKGQKDQAPLPEDRAEALLTQILISGRAAQVLAGCLTEKGKRWTFEEAQRNAQIFAAVTDAAQKERMRTALIEFVLGFFLFATASVATSPRSSSLN